MVKINLNHPKNIQIFFWIVGLSLAFLQAVAYRNIPSSEDIVSYLDIADAYLQRDWTHAINGNWSPLYSWILGLTMGILRASPFLDFPTVKLVNFMMFIFSFVSFEFLLNGLPPDKLLQVPSWVRLSLAYTLFLFSGLYWVGINCDTPDMSTVGLIYLAAGLVLRISKEPERWLNFIFLGIVLAFGYFSKAVMLPLSFVFLIVAFLTVRNFHKALPRTIATFLVLVLVTSPYISALSLKLGKLTFSETGKLSYIWYIYPTASVIPDRHWQGGNPEFGIPKHPTRKIFSNPDIFEFDKPIGGTYSPWTDPSYWYEGIIPRFNLKASLNIFAQNILFYQDRFLGALVFCYLLLAILYGRLAIIRNCLMENWHLLTISISGLGIYALSTNFVVNNLTYQPSTRFIAAFSVLLFIGIFSKVPIPKLKFAKRLVVSLSIVTLLFVSVQFSFMAAKALVVGFGKGQNIHWQVAEGMNQLGLRPGDKIAVINNSNSHVFWARLAQVRIIVEHSEPQNEDNTKWIKDETTFTNVLKAIQEAGVDVVVTQADETPPATFPYIKWKQAGNTKYFAYFLRNP